MKHREIDGELVVRKTEELILKTNFDLNSDVENCFKKNSAHLSEQEKGIMKIMLENIRTARSDGIPLCQDTGLSIFIVEIGHVAIKGKKNISSLINDAVRSAYKTGRLRPSILKDPLRGGNTLDNTPAIIHFEITDTEKLIIKYLAKGGGSENAGAVRMLKPSDGAEGIKNFVMERVSEYGINACPPLIIGIGIGGTMEHCAYLSKKALFRNIEQRNIDPFYSQIELDLLNMINKTGIGMQGLGGNFTAMDVFIEQSPRHMATLPVAVSILCHSARKGSVEL